MSNKTEQHPIVAELKAVLKKYDAEIDLEYDSEADTQHLTIYFLKTDETYYLPDTFSPNKD